MLKHTIDQIDQMDAWSSAQLAIQSKANDPYFCTPYGQVRYSNIDSAFRTNFSNTDSITFTTGTSLSQETLDQIYNVFHTEDKTEMNRHETKIDQYGFEKIIQNGSAVIVFWTDKTKTVVKLKEDDCYDIYAAVAQALAKKIYGYNSAFHKMVDKVTENHTAPMESVKASTMAGFKKFWDGVWNLSHPEAEE